MAEYTYDVFGRRVKKKIVSGGQNVQEIAYHYMGYSLSVAKETERLWETDHWGAWRTRREYLLNGGLAAHIVGVRHYDYSRGGAPVVKLYRYVYDPSGNVAAVLNEDGLMVYVDRYGKIESAPTTGYVACRFEYDAYGNNVYPWDDWNKYLAMQKAWETFPHHISTKEWDTEANLYYFGHRWYEPRQGAYVSRTPLGPLDEESYSYCHNDPVNYIDVDGYRVRGSVVTIASTILFGGSFTIGSFYDERGNLGFGLGPSLQGGVDAGLSIGRFRSNADTISELDGAAHTADINGNCPVLGPILGVGINTSFGTNYFTKNPNSKLIGTAIIGFGIGAPAGPSGAGGVSWTKTVSVRVPILSTLIDWLIPDDDSLTCPLDIMFPLMP